ncbi:MAG TPA: tetratricopeptide repeat protein [Polyangiaceae bacterium]
MRLTCAGLAASLALLAPSAFAAGPKPPEPKGGGTFTLSHTGNAAADAARARVLAGDCKGALDLFDEALRKNVDPVLRRDRGACHEQLGDVFPAIDDYRAYLAAMPDAVDAGKIREHLKAPEDAAPKDQLRKAADYDTEMRGGVGSAPSIDAKKAPKDEPPPRELSDADKGKSQSILEYEEQRDVEMRTSSLRQGTGPVLGAYFFPRYWVRGGGLAAKDNFGQGVGLALRWSFSKTSSVIGEIGYASLGPSGAPSSRSGLQLFVGYEARVALDHWATNHFFFGGGGGYEDAKQDASGTVYRSIMARGRAGYRHVFGSNVGLEFLGDGGAAVTFSAGGGSTAATVTPVIGGQVGFVVGF